MIIALRVPTHTQRIWFDILQKNMPDDKGKGTVREQIIRKYLDNCAENSERTVSSCNTELTEAHKKPLTGTRGRNL